VATDVSPSANAPRASLPVAAGVTLLAVALMAWDHLWGNEGGSDSFPVDPGAFALALALVMGTAALVFGVTVPRARQPHRAGLVHSLVALLLTLPGAWLGFPIVVAGGGIALGLQALGGPHRRTAVVAIAIGALVLVFAVLSTAFPSQDVD
jgi:hypothetical protein